MTSARRAEGNAMSAADPTGNDEARGEAALIAAAGNLLRQENREVPADFIAGLFARAVPEDLMRYAARELAELAAEAWALMLVRKPGTANVRFNSPEGTGAHPRLKTVSVLEIVNDDMPFLLDSVLGALTERGIEALLVLHPVFTVKRDAAGRRIGFAGTQSLDGALRESFIHLHTNRIDSGRQRAEIVESLQRVLRDVRVCVADWRIMLARVGETIAELKRQPPPLPVAEIAEAVDFLDWLVADNFTFLGIRNYAFADGGRLLEPVFESGLGLLRAREMPVVRRWNEPLVITPEIRALLHEPRLLIVTKAAARSLVHRRVYMDYVGVKRFDASGAPAGELRIVGLFTSTAYTSSTRSIPYLRRKVDHVVARAGFDAEGHSGKALVNVLETYPRGELFQIDAETLYQCAIAGLPLD